MARAFSPLRYPGGKGALANFIKAIIARNELWGCDYAEPYCGGAGIAIELLKLELVSKVHINDVDPAIHKFWSSILRETEEFCALVSKAPLTIRFWRKQRNILKDLSGHSDIEIGFAAFFLNRVNRSGILTAGPIGGIEQTGTWLMDARFNRASLIQSVQSIARFGNRIEVYALDAAQFLRRANKWAAARTLCYLDPPYVVQGKRLYRNFYTEADHIEIANLARSLKCPWIVSYDNVELIDRIYADFRKITYSISYSANIRSTGHETMIFCNELSLPSQRSPLKISEKMWRQAGCAA